MTTKEELTKHYHDTIYKWVVDNFGESEAEEPSWNIDALADELAKAENAYKVANIVDDMWLTEDAIYMAGETEQELTEEEIKQVVDWYKNHEELDREAWEWAITRVVRRRNGR